MSSYDQFFKRLDDLRKRTARFRRVALHLHSPESCDWADQPCDKALNDRDMYLAENGEMQFIDALKPHIDLVAITDHMKCGYASKVSRLSQTYGEFLAVPGMEINIQPEAAVSSARLHILAILPESSSPEKFSRLFSGLSGIPDDAQRTGNELITNLGLKEFIKRIHEEKGLCVAAHVNSQQGIRSQFRQTGREVISLVSPGTAGSKENEQEISDILKEYLFSVGFDAIEVAKASDQRHYRWISKCDGIEVSIPVIMSFDAHRVEDFNRLDRITWVKMTNLSVKGLREALQFAETRVRFSIDLPVPPNPRLVGVEIVGTNNSLFKNIHIALAENLNCLIGPRGSGKSTIVEALRYVFGYNRTLSELDTTNRLSDRIKSLQRANLSGCLIRVAYQTVNKERCVLEATFDPNEDYASKVFSESGDFLNISDIETSGEYPLRLFGWSEIETLGRESARQRDLLDRLIPDLASIINERNNIRAKLRSNRKEIEKIINELKDKFIQKNGIIQRYTEYKAAFDKLNTTEIKTYFMALDLAQNKKRVLEQVNSNISKLLNKIIDITEVTFRDNIDDILSQAEQELGDWWLTDEITKLKIVENEAEIQKYITAAIKTLESLSTLINQHTILIDEDISRTHANIRTAFSEDASLQRIADLRTNAEKRLREASALRDEYLKVWSKLKETIGINRAIGDDLINCQDRIAGIRARQNNNIEEKLNHFFGAEMKVSLRFIAGGDTNELINRSSKIASCIAKNYKARQIPQFFGVKFNPVTLSRVFIDNQPSLLEGQVTINDTTITISNAEAKKAMDTCTPWSRDDAADVDCLVENGDKLLHLIELEEVEWDDEVSILLNDRPVSELSPGQRSSAMLPLIALSETTPLVIDQPEDNLDNKLIGKVLTDILAALKERRQIIVCTHNPNIVVSGDAEQVIVLNAISDRKAEVLRHGSIDNDDIVRAVIEIMEGGAEAFRVRRQRYNL
ncbi:MAG: TrlF family AAA-like ATPase [Thermodesulfobacteriota bacterium]